MTNFQVSSRTPLISVVTPCFNEEESIRICVEELYKIFVNELPEYRLEHIVADNKSTDDTVDILRELCIIYPHLKVIRNSRNVGPFRNMWNALQSATGDAVVPMLPADLQDPPQVIPQFIRKWEKGSSVVYGVRRNRKDPFWLKISRRLYYKIVAMFGESSLPANAGEFMLVDAVVVKSISQIQNEYPYIRGIIAQASTDFEVVEYDWKVRAHGKSHNSFWQLVDQAVNGFISTSKAPARLALISGFVFSGFGVAFALFNIISELFFRTQISAGVPTIITGIFFFGGLQLFFTGLIGEYILSIHSQVKGSPRLMELERLNFEE